MWTHRLQGFIRYWGVFWIDAKDLKSAERSFSNIAEKCGCRETNIADTCYWLANTEHNWLLIIDNADDPEFDYSRYFPTGGRGSILLTSRSPDCEVFQNVGSEEIARLDIKDAAQLLLKASAIREELWNASMADADRVVKTLDSHTLAIIQAGAFIKKRFSS